jgi:hypothetical protein
MNAERRSGGYDFVGADLTLAQPVAKDAEIEDDGIEGVTIGRRAGEATGLRRCDWSCDEIEDQMACDIEDLGGAVAAPRGRLNDQSDFRRLAVLIADIGG